MEWEDVLTSGKGVADAVTEFLDFFIVFRVGVLSDWLVRGKVFKDVCEEAFDCC